MQKQEEEQIQNQNGNVDQTMLTEINLINNGCVFQVECDRVYEALTFKVTTALKCFEQITKIILAKQGKG